MLKFQQKIFNQTLVIIIFSAFESNIVLCHLFTMTSPKSHLFELFTCMGANLVTFDLPNPYSNDFDEVIVSEWQETMLEFFKKGLKIVVFTSKRVTNVWVNTFC